MKLRSSKIGAHLRVVLGPGVWIGPGKADLLEGIRDTGSIAAAGRRMGMSYKRAWSLVEILNVQFREPLVDAAPGGRSGGGSSLSELGEDVLKRYRAMERRVATSINGDIEALRGQLAAISKQK